MPINITLAQPLCSTEPSASYLSMALQDCSIYIGSNGLQYEV